jgi:uncharacterized membrane protein
MSEKWDHYNADALVRDVIGLLKERGIRLSSERNNPAEQAAAASKLLSSLGVVPTRSTENVMDLDGHKSYNRRIHED